jgi:4-amino-4-deoxy-L-arabinose transferase-like glycosyltransferase
MRTAKQPRTGQIENQPAKDFAKDGPDPARPLTYLLAVALSVLLSCEVLLALAPPIARDALIHHLAVPKLWLRHGAIHEIPWADFSYYPMNIDLVYLAALILGSDILANLAHLLFGAATGLLIYLYLKNKVGREWGLFGAFIFLSTPIVIRLSTMAYVDLGMTFFTTASLLALLQWRESDYRDGLWMALSAIAMGLALGSKYNALIAWFFLNLMVVFYYSRDRGGTGQALKKGILFFTLTLLVASPWYIKNMVLTGNPLYPLLERYFHHFTQQGGGRGGLIEVAASGGWFGIFQTRQLLYGEGFWETVLIPLRIFFQGRDDSDRYFDGVLNPLLLIMIPFAFLKDPQRRDSLSFLLFSVYFLLMALFSEVVRVRYILPVLPFFTILTAQGTKNLAEKIARAGQGVRILGLAVLSVLVMACMAANGLYLRNYFQSIGPLPYIIKTETRDAFLTRHLGSYPAIRYINGNLPANARIYLMFLGRRGYYLDRDYRHDATSGMELIDELAKIAGDGKRFSVRLQAMECTHVLLRTDLFEKYLLDNYPEKIRKLLLAAMEENMTLVYESGGYAVLTLPH